MTRLTAQRDCIYARPRSRGCRGASTPVALLAVVIVALFAASTLSLVVGDFDSKPDHPDEWDQRVADIAAFVEKERELEFVHPVFVDFLPEGEFEAEVRGGDTDETEETEEIEEIEQAAAVLRIAGLIDPGFDLKDSADRFVTAGIIGVYDPDDERIMIKGEQATPAVRGTLAHELTHALQDQRFDLDREFETDSQDLAFTAVVEADAGAVEEAYVATLSEGEQAQVEEAEDTDPQQREELQSLPPALVESFAFPYVMGPFFIEAIQDEQGLGRVNEALINPPTLDVDILQPDRFIRKVEPRPVEPPELNKGDDRIDSFELGQLSLLHVLAGHGPFEPAWNAVQAFENDAGVVYENNEDKVCFRDNVVLSSPAAADALVAASSAWTNAVPGTKAVRTATGVELGGCDPGSAAPTAPKVGVLSAFVLRAETSDSLGMRVAAGELTKSQADCVATAVAGILGPESAKLNDLPERVQRATIQRTFREATARCPS